MEVPNQNVEDEVGHSFQRHPKAFKKNKDIVQNEKYRAAMPSRLPSGWEVAICQSWGPELKKYDGASPLKKNRKDEQTDEEEEDENSDRNGGQDEDGLFNAIVELFKRRSK
ncbi:hypothetical protein Y032_0006g3093 [Ancylostoma ceylanicum]|uniref:Uncharacterized protein n=1 Tax=Ancylostoma ceylanicum TaxID=53326 RepID=A0A016VQQ3_9BILA|nr:hypothetical protein Y032_0006g3093 [Ancylostoma ceylanicum]